MWCLPAKWVALLLVTAMALAGCMNDEQSGPEENGADEVDGLADNGGAGDGNGLNETEPSTFPAAWRYSGCTTHQGIFFPPAEIFDWLPDGFTPIQGPDPLGVTTIAMALAFDCGNVTSESFGELQDVEEFHMYLVVDPPADYTDPEMMNYLFHMFGVVEEEAFRSVFHDANITRVDPGSVAISRTSTTAGETGEVQVENPNVGVEFDFHTATEGMGETTSAFKVRTFGFNEDNSVSHVIDFDVPEGMITQGTGKIVVSDPSDIMNALGTGLGMHHYDEWFSMTPKRVSELE